MAGWIYSEDIDTVRGVRDWDRLVVEEVIDTEFEACFNDDTLTAIVIVNYIVY
jgi:hypothetical protein